MSELPPLPEDDNDMPRADESSSAPELERPRQREMEIGETHAEMGETHEKIGEEKEETKLEAPPKVAHDKFMERTEYLGLADITEDGKLTRDTPCGGIVATEFPVYSLLFAAQNEEEAVVDLLNEYLNDFQTHDLFESGALNCRMPSARDQELSKKFNLTTRGITLEFFIDRVQAIRAYTLHDYSLFNGLLLNSGVYRHVPSFARACEPNCTVLMNERLAMVVALRDLKQGEAPTIPVTAFQTRVDCWRVCVDGCGRASVKSPHVERSVYDTLLCLREMPRRFVQSKGASEEKAKPPPEVGEPPESQPKKQAPKTWQELAAVLQTCPFDEGTSHFKTHWLAMCALMDRKCLNSADLINCLLASRNAPLETRFIVLLARQCSNLAISELTPEEVLEFRQYAKLFGLMVVRMASLFDTALGRVVCNVVEGGDELTFAMELLSLVE
jgi:hypothetical protein